MNMMNLYTACQAPFIDTGEYSLPSYLPRGSLLSCNSTMYQSPAAATRNDGAFIADLLVNAMHALIAIRLPPLILLYIPQIRRGMLDFQSSQGADQGSPFLVNSPLLLTGLPPAGRPAYLSTGCGYGYGLYSLLDLIYRILLLW